MSIDLDKAFGGWFYRNGEWQFEVDVGNGIAAYNFLNDVYREPGPLCFVFVCYYEADNETLDAIKQATFPDETLTKALLEEIGDVDELRRKALEEAT